MTLADKISMIDQLIREDPEATIKSFEMKHKSYNEQDIDFIETNCEAMTVKDLAEARTLNVGVVYQIVRKKGWTAKKAERIRREPPVIHINPNRIRAIAPDPPKKPFVRPAAVYSNTGGFQEVKRKYL